jgi:hypothetical protein
MIWFMSATPTKFHATFWTIGILSVLVLYVATWPFVELKFGNDPPQVVPNPDGYTIDLNLGPPWINTVYGPLQRLRDLKGPANPVRGYWLWCVRLRGSRWIDPWHSVAGSVSRDGTRDLRRRSGSN